MLGEFVFIIVISFYWLVYLCILSVYHHCAPQKHTNANEAMLLILKQSCSFVWKDWNYFIGHPILINMYWACTYNKKQVVCMCYEGYCFLMICKKEILQSLWKELNHIHVLIFVHCLDTR